MRFVVGYYLTQNAQNNPKEPRTAARTRKAVRRPGTKWLAALRPTTATARGSRRSQTARAPWILSDSRSSDR
jgi:hypothetical protein